MTDPKQDTTPDEELDEAVQDLEAPAETQHEIAGGAALHAATPTAAAAE